MIPPRVSKGKTSIIDLIFSDMKHVFRTGVIECNISDHLPIFIIRKKINESKTYEEITVRNYRNFEILKFQAKIGTLDLTLYDSNDVSHNGILSTNTLLAFWTHTAPIIRLKYKRIDLLHL